MRRPPTRTTGTAMKAALQRVEDIAAFQLGRLRLDAGPAEPAVRAGPVRAGHQGAEAGAGPGAQAHGDAHRGDAPPGGEGDRRRAGPFRDADGHPADQLREAVHGQASACPRCRSWRRRHGSPPGSSKVIIEELELIEASGCDVDVAALWRALEEVAPRAALSSAAATVVSLVPEDDGTAETALRGALALRYNTVRPFLSLLGESKALDAAPGRQTDPRRGAAAPGSLPAEGGREAAAAARGRRQAGAGALAQGRVRERRSCRRGRWTGTRTWCVCWSSCSAR